MADDDEKAWERLQATYAKSGVTLVLGAGVSAGCGLPDWGTLLRRLAERVWRDAPDPPASTYDELARMGFSLPAIASMLETDAKAARFAGMVRDALYADFPPRQDVPLRGEEKRRWQRRLVRFVDGCGGKSATLRAVAALCARRAGREFHANPHVHALLTLNLDSVLQQYARARYDRRLLRTVERPSAGAKVRLSDDQRRIPIYHIHGHLRFDWRWDDPTKGAPDARVLTEQEYYDFFGAPYGVFTYTFLYHLRQHACVFLGLSLTDENLRRLMHYSAVERVRSLRREGTTARRARDRSVRHFAVLKHRAPHLDALVARSLRRLGTSPVWVDDFSEIPARLGAMYDAAGDDWRRVFADGGG